MAGPNFVLDKGFIVESTATVANLGLGRAVKFGATNTAVTSIAAATDQPLGIMQETLDAAKVATGKATVDVRMIGISRCVAGAAVTRGARVTVDSTGRVVAAAPAAGANSNIVGMALSPAGTAGDFIDVLLNIGTTFQG